LGSPFQNKITAVHTHTKISSQRLAYIV